MKKTPMHLPLHVLILGCGFTGERVARHLLRRGTRVTATTRHPARLQSLRTEGAEIVPFEALDDAELRRLPALAASADAVVCSIPTLRANGEMVERTPAIVRALETVPQRLLYLSTTGVYGRRQQVDERTAVQPETPRELLRVEAENAVLGASPGSLVLRPAAIYGPGRGVHVSMQLGKYRLTGDGGNFISRVHVDDLAAHVVAALGTDIAGAWPVADEEPCTQREMAAFCAELLGLPLPESAAPGAASETLRANRQVDGSAIRRLLGISLRYPSYRQGVPAALHEEREGLIAPEE